MPAEKQDIVLLPLTRRNLTTLLAKLDKNVANADTSACTIIKHDTEHLTYPIVGADTVVVQALEDDEYYAERQPGVMIEDLE